MSEQGQQPEVEKQDDEPELDKETLSDLDIETDSADAVKGGKPADQQPFP